jgi:hypothetical protein
MKFIPPVQRKEGTAFGRQYHYYVDGDNHRIPGVTTILNDGLPKPELVGWAANITAEGAINHWDQLADLPPAARLKELQSFRWETTNTAKDKGTQVHLYGEALVQGIEIANAPIELRPYIENYARFLDAWDVKPFFVEVVVANYTHGYAGTLDLVADIQGLSGETERWLLDLKTGGRVYPETALQLAAYRYAEAYIDNNGDEQPMIPVQYTGAIHVTIDDATLIPTQSGPDELLMFRLVQKVAEHKKDEDRLMMPTLQLPNGSKAHIVWEDPQ